MKINANPMASFNREVPRNGPPARQERPGSIQPPADTPKAAPPGLERALARLQAMDAGERTAGQTNAMNQIERNLAKYAETRAIATPEPEAISEESVVSTPGEETPEVPTEVASNPVGDGVLVDALLDSIQGGTSTPA